MANGEASSISPHRSTHRIEALTNHTLVANHLTRAILKRAHALCRKSPMAPSKLDWASSSASNTTTLMTLPAELRLEIFEYLIRPGDVYIRYRAKAANHDVRFSHIIEDWDASTPSPAHLTDKSPPKAPTSAETQLFLVSMQLRDEAMHYYLTQNTFHMMGSDCALPYLS